MKIRILQSIYNSLPIPMFKPKSIKYNVNCKRLEQLRSTLHEHLSAEQLAMLENYIALLDEQSLAEQQQSFCVGVAVGAGFKREVKTLLKRKGK